MSLISAAHTMTDHGSAPSRQANNTITAAAAQELTPGDYAAAWERGRTLDLDTILTP